MPERLADLGIVTVERVTRIELALSAWEVAATVHVLPCGFAVLRRRPELHILLSASDRRCLLFTEVNGTLMARRSCPRWRNMRQFCGMKRSACARGERSDTLRANAEQGGIIADRQSPCDQFGGSFTGAGLSSGSELVGLAA